MRINKIQVEKNGAKAKVHVNASASGGRTKLARTFDDFNGSMPKDVSDALAVLEEKLCGAIAREL